MAADLPARASAARLPAARRRRQLLDIARRTFADRGYHVTSMNDIAAAAGVTKPVLYQHFRSKRELYLELLDDVGGHLMAAIDDATGSATGPREQVEAGFRAYFRFVAGNEDAFRVLFGGGTRRDEEFNNKVREVEDAIAEAIAALIEVPGLDRDTGRLLAHGLVGLAEGTSRHWLARGLAGDPDHLAAWVSDLAWAGLRGLGTRWQTHPQSTGPGS
jgi:AcrR family transcriptional regulator